MTRFIVILTMLIVLTSCDFEGHEARNKFQETADKNAVDICIATGGMVVFST